MKGMKKVKLSKGAGLAKIKWDEAKHKREASGRFTFKPGSEEFKAEPFGAGKTSGVLNTDVIKLHVKANPKKAGSASAADFAKYQDNMTVGEFKAAVGPMAQAHLSHDTKKGFITIHDPKTLPPTEKELAFSDYVITSKTSGVQPTDKIKLLSPNNPKKPGSKSAADFAKYKDEMTVAEFHVAVGDKKMGQTHILHDMKKGYISIHDPAELKLLKTGQKSPGQAAAEMKVGDKKLGVTTTNPFTPGTKNHADFEATAKKLGLQTPTTTAATAPTPTPAPKPTAASTLKDDDVVESWLGNKYTVAEYKKKFGYSDNAGVQQAIDAGSAKLVPKAAAPTAAAGATTAKAWSDETLIVSQASGKTFKIGDYKKQLGYSDSDIETALKYKDIKLKTPAPTTAVLKDTDVIVTEAGNEYSVKYLKNLGYSEGSIQTSVTGGTWKIKGAPIGAAVPKVIGVKDIPPGKTSDYDLVLQTSPSANPYPYGSNEYIKFQSLVIKNGKMSVAQYNNTKALSPSEKTTTLQKLIDDGHVKLVTPDNKAAVATQQQKIINKSYDAHLKEVKPANWTNDPKWSKVAGADYDLHNAAWGGLSTSSPQWKTMTKMRSSLGLTYNSNSAGSTSQAVSWYCGSGYTDGNSTLREKGFDFLSSGQKNYVKQLDNIMEETKNDTIMWRGVRKNPKTGENLNNMPPPDEFVDGGFTSVSFNPIVSQGFAGHSDISGQSMRTLFRVRMPKGTKAANIGRRPTTDKALKDEAEVIIARGTRYKYISTTRGAIVGGAKYDIIEVEVVQDTGGNI